MFFYKKYSNSKLATVLSVIGGICYFGTLYLLYISFTEESVPFSEALCGVLFMLAFGYGFNKLAENVATKKAEPVTKNEISHEDVIKSNNEPAWKCTSCGHMNNSGKFCSECGKEKIVYKNNFCKKCGTKLEENVKFCSNCGTKIE